MVIQYLRAPVFQRMRKPDHTYLSRTFLFATSLVGLMFSVQNAGAQFLRLGPLDFFAKSRLEGVYSSNVENERDSEATGEQEDFFIIVGLDLSANSMVAPSTDLNIDTGVYVERHLNRKDLNDSSNPFARGKISTLTEIGRYTLLLNAGYERTSASQEESNEAFFGTSRLTRRVKDMYGYSATLRWDYDPIMLSAGTDFTADRYVEEEEQINDKDDTGYLYEARWDITRRINLGYSYDKQFSDLINVPDEDDNATWDITQRILLRFKILEKPSFNYGFGYEKADTGGEEGQWDQIHNFDVQDEVDITSTLKLGGSVSYEYDPNPEEDTDVSFRYGVTLDHEISRTARQILSVSREPVSTFGSTATTDSTMYQYRFNKDDLFIYNLSFDFTVSYSVDEQLDSGEVDKVWTYGAGVAHMVPLSRQLSRKIEYRYTREDDKDNPELLEEHRVTLTYEYRF